MEEQAAELEKDLIVKELQTLDVLEELGATKRIVEDLKQQLQKQALRCFAAPVAVVHSHENGGTPVVKEMNNENCGNTIKNQGQILHSASSCPMSSSDQILMDIKQTKVNIGKTINDLGVIQSSVESLNKKMKKEKIFIQRTREKLASKFAAVSAQERAQEQLRLNPSVPPVEVSSTFSNPVNIMRGFNSESELPSGMFETKSFDVSNGMVETKTPDVSNPFPVKEDNGLSMKTAEMRLFAAKKMEEAARAAEAIALAEIKALSSNERSSGLAPELQKVTFALREQSSLNPTAQIPEESTFKKVTDSKYQIDDTNVSKLTILKWLEEASAEILHSKQVLTEALNRVETANNRQHAAEEALRRWFPDSELKGQVVYNSIRSNKLNHAGNYQNSALPDVIRSTTRRNYAPKPALRSTVSLRDVLSRKQVPEEYATRKEMEDHTARQKVALSQMLRALREDLTIPTEDEKDQSHQKHSTAPKKKFGFIHISLPLAKPNKKRA